MSKNEASEQLKEIARENFSDAELESFINMGAQLASKSVLTAVAFILREANTPRGDKLARKVERLIPYNYSGYMQCTFTETPYKLNVCLSIVQRDYQCDVSVPNEDYAKDLYKKYTFLKNVAVAYWRQFSEQYPKLVKQIAEHRSDIDWAELVIDKASPTTLYFDPASARRVGLFCYYVDPQGNPLRKRV
jgi:hypothetical protein